MSRSRALSLLLAAGASVWLLALVMLQGLDLLTSPWLAGLWCCIGAALGAAAVYFAWSQRPTAT
jgi:hypothetical protein